MKLQTPFCKMQRQTTEIENVELARNATSRGRLGRRLLGRGWRRFANGDRGGRDGAAHSRHLKPGSARLLAEGAVSVWRFGSGSGDGVRMPAVALPPLGPAHYHIDPPLLQRETPAPRANRARARRRRTEQPSRRDRARFDAGRLCTKRSTGRGRRRRCRASSAGPCSDFRIALECILVAF
jgi:hypothetical protein